ncbi:MAG: hypothetical protein BXU00_01495 [Candidatus Nanoclepta minutus]|uniref:Uncharacterized protein n=1 Tax=Candidatus Nanoclepta minutus TaxID=1940235 RepID=A0A397WQS0_9ARCH|nr:MAG: hypothetical protein BXU00_01495 [Candidatus Nanoclepta minutus]
MYKGLIEKAIEGFNLKFNSECKLLGIRDKEFDILFRGHICFTCGAYDYFEDLRVILEERIGKKVYLKEYKQNEDGSYIVTYIFERIEKPKRDIKIIFYDE